MKTKDIPHSEARQDRLIRERVHDPYKARLKMSDPAVCPDCNAVYENGRWHWGETPTGAAETTCQACQRIQDQYPAGELTLRGDFLWQHRSEILHLARNQEDLEKGEHPLHRIMAMSELPEDRAVVVTTTDIHLPRRIGEAVHHAYQGDFDFRYDDEGYFLRASWSRES